MRPNVYAALLDVLASVDACAEALRTAPHCWEEALPVARQELERSRLALDHLQACVSQRECGMLQGGATMRVEELRRLAEQAVEREGPEAKLLLEVRGSYTAPPKRRQLWRGGPRAAVEELVGEKLVVSIGASELLEVLRREDVIYVDARPRRSRT